MGKVRKNQGITLIALVITIIIIIVLSTVTINMAFGDNGLITQAQKAKDMTANSIVAEQEGMNSVLSEYLNVMGDESEITPPVEEEPPIITNISTSNVTTNSITVTVTATAGTSEITSYAYSITGQEPVTIADASYTFTGLTANTQYTIQVTVADKAGKTAIQSLQATTNKITVSDVIDGTEFTNTTPIKDDLDNTVYIPGGFHLATDSGTKVEEGIVIEDNTENKNQFVWIPVGTYNVTNEVDSDGTKDGKMTNELTRRTFASSGATEINGDSVILGRFYGEGDSRSVTYNQIGKFKTSATTNGGFYIGRYEQGTGNICKYGVAPYTDVTRDTAKSEAEAMYSGNSDIKATTELISSYAWDTALNFICQTNTEGYTLATTISSSYGNMMTGNKTQTGEYEADDYSKIHDFLGNCEEWTTEYLNYSDYFCVSRGGGWGLSSYNADYRYSYRTNNRGDALSFRSQLYV